jgi:integral membrane protein (TIGR00529 family)
MEENGLLAKLAATMESISPKLALHFIPAVIGLVPMPAGALVSATAARDLVKKIGLTPEQSTFINYWFRHIWEFSLPVYPAIILTSVVLSVPISLVVVTLSPMTALTVVSGAVISYGILKKTLKVKGNPTKNIAYNLVRASWPILLLVSSILLGLEAMIAFPLVLVLLAVQQRANWPELKKALKYGLDLRILFLLYAVMLYKTTIESSGAAQQVFLDMQAMGLPASVILAVLPLLMGLATGFSMAFAGVALPLLVPYIASDLGINSYALLLAYVSGMMGLFLSPLHLCLILSAEYFKANLAKMYKYILPPTIVIEAIAILIYYIAS